MVSFFQKLPELSDHNNKSPITKKKRSETQGDDSHETSSLLLSPTKKLRRSSQEEEFLDEKRWRSHNTRSLLIDVDLRLDTPLSPVVPWRTDPNTPWKQTQNLGNKKNAQKTTLLPSTKDPISLDLGLNLLCSTKSSTNNNNNNNYQELKEGNYYKKSLAGEVDREEEEMVAKACMRCHMLVMMCKSSPSCPNCKFMHPLDHHNNPPHSSSTLLMLKPRPTNNNKTSSCLC